MYSPISATSSPGQLRRWVSYLGETVGAADSPVWGWLSVAEPQVGMRTHIPVNRLRPLVDWVTQEDRLQGGGQFWLLTRYQGHVLAVVVANESGLWSVQRERFQSWAWS
jgi:hypothetical protein